MGFSEIATHSVWFFLFVAIATPVGSDAVQAWNDLDDARADAREFRFERRATSLDIRSMVYDKNAETFTLTVRNGGTVPLEVEQTEILIWGLRVPYTVTVEGVSTDFWQPGEDAAFVVTKKLVDTVPVLLVAENGVRAYASFTAPKPPELHSANITTYNGATLTTHFVNGQTATIKVIVHDAYHQVVSGASVTVRLDRPDGGTETLGPATTDASGVASMDRKLVGGDPDGTYTVTVTALQKAGYQENLAASEETTNTFTKSK